MKAFLRGFGHAGRGVWQAVKSERNMRFHLCAAAYVVWLAGFYAFTTGQWVLLVLCIAGVLAAELLNTAVEQVVDGLVNTQSAAARFAKDAAAGAVLVVCIGAAVCGFLLFWQPDTLRGVGAWLLARPWRAVLLTATLVASTWFTFGFGGKDKHGR